MRSRLAPVLWTACAALWTLGPAGAHAAPAPAIGAIPTWVHPEPIPETAPPALSATAAAVAPGDVTGVVETLLDDQQVRFAGPTTTLYRARAIRILRPEVIPALARIVVAWAAATDRVTFHSLRLIHAGQSTDLLPVTPDATGFTIRPTTNGIASALRTIPGVQVGDVIAFAYTVARTDPLLGAHHEITLATDTATHLALSAQWDAGDPVAIRAENLPAPASSPTGITLLASNLAPWAGPAGAPDRYHRGRTLAFSDYASWQDVAAVVRPWFAAARTIAPASPLQREIDRIAADHDPVARAAAALALAQRRVRYLYDGAGEANLRPASADATWQAGAGDCKGKVALLLALLDGLGIPAAPALVSTTDGDGLDQRLPGMQVFDHVIVRAVVGGNRVWLDPTRDHDGTLAALPIPPWHWALNLATGALEPLTVPPATRPGAVIDLTLDAAHGLAAPAPTHAEATLHGDAAQSVHAAIATLPPARRAAALRGWWARRHDFVAPFAVAEHWDAKTGTECLTMRGVARLDWARDAGRAVYRLSETRLAGDPVRRNGAAPTSRAPADADAPYAIPYPDFTEVRETVLLPDNGAGFRVAGADVDTVIARRAFWRHTEHVGNRVTTVARIRPLAAEVPGAEVRAAASAMEQLASSDVTITAPSSLAQADIARADIARADIAVRTPAARESTDQEFAIEPRSP